MADGTDVDLAEFSALRDEINGRTNLAYTLVGVQLATLGAGLAVFQQVPEVIVGLAAGSSFLWLFWIDHAGQIYKVAAYIALRLSPRIQAQNRGALGWELFLRELDAGGQRSLQVLFPGDGQRRLRRFMRTSTMSVNLYTGLLFGASSPLLLGSYLVSRSITLDREGAIRLTVFCLSAVLWAFAVWRYVLYHEMVETIGEAILEATKDTSPVAMDTGATDEPGE